MLVAEWISTFAVLISLISLGVSLDLWLRDRYKLKYSVALVTTVSTNPTYRICVVVTNEGRRPISIVTVFYEDEADAVEYPIRSPIYGGFPYGSQKSIDLAENQTKEFTSKELSRTELLKRTKNLTVGVIDSKNKVYNMKLENEAFSDL